MCQRKGGNPETRFPPIPTFRTAANGEAPAAETEENKRNRYQLLAIRHFAGSPFNSSIDKLRLTVEWMGAGGKAARDGIGLVVGGCLDGQPTTGYTNQQRNRTPIEGNFVMAKKKPTEAALTNVLNTTIELLQDAENADDDGMITVSNSVYMRLRAAVKEATGIAYGIAVSEVSEEDDEDEDGFDEEDD